MGVGQFAEFGEGALKDFINLDRELQKKRVELSYGTARSRRSIAFPLSDLFVSGEIFFKFFVLKKKNIALCWCAVVLRRIMWSS